jgi:hypothetical protein
VLQYSWKYIEKVFSIETCFEVRRRGAHGLLKSLETKVVKKQVAEILKKMKRGHK